MSNVPTGASIQVVEGDGVLYAARVFEGRVYDLAAQRTADSLVQQTVLAGRVVKRLGEGSGALVDIGQASSAPLARPDNVREGALVPVQLTASLRAMRDGKMPPVTRDIALPGRYFIHRPYSTGLSFSRRIAARDRQNLQEGQLELGKGGWLVRAAAINQPIEKIVFESQTLADSARVLDQRLEGKRPGDVLLEGPAVWQRTILDEPSLASIDVQPATLRRSIIAWLKSHSPDFVDRIQPSAPAALLTLLDDIDWLLVPQIALDDGASLWIESTRAMIAVDVDAPLGARRAVVNRQAAETLAAQIRLRNLGGMIGVDFLRMGKAAERQRVLSCLRDGLESHQGGSPAQLHFAPDFSPVGPYVLSRQQRGCSLADVIDGTDE